MKKFIAILLSMSLCIAMLAGCGSSSDDSTESTDVETEESTTVESESSSDAEEAEGTDETDDTELKVVTVAYPSTWNTLCPMNPGSAYTLEIAGFIYDSLIRINTAGEGEPRAAESWEVSDDSMSITLYLREDSYFHDGTQVTSADWLYTIELMTSEGGSACVTQDKYSCIEGTSDSGLLEDGSELGVETPDDFTLVIHFKEAMNADTFFYDYSKMWYVLPSHICSEYDQTDVLNWDFWQSPVGSGPFVFVSESSGTELVMDTNYDYYYDIDFDQLICGVVETESALATLMAGELDIYFYAWTPDDLLTVEDNEDLTIVELEGAASLHFLSINNDKFSVEVRQAINLAIDKDLIVETVYGGAGVATNSSVNPFSEYFINSWEGRDIEAAQALLDESGFDYSQTLVLATSSGRGETTAAIIQQNLAEIGITVEIETVDTTTGLAGARDGTYDLYIKNNTSAGSPTWIVSSDLSLAANTVAHISDPYYDELAAAVAVASDSDELASLAEEFQEYCDEQMPFAVLCDSYDYYVTSSRISNITAVETTAPWEWVVD